MLLELPSIRSKFCPDLHSHASVLARVGFKGLNAYPTEVSSKPPRGQSGIEARVGKKPAPQRRAAPRRRGRGPQRWAGGGRVRAMPGCAHPLPDASSGAHGAESSRYKQQFSVGITPRGVGVAPLSVQTSTGAARSSAGSAAAGSPDRGAGRGARGGEARPAARPGWGERRLPAAAPGSPPQASLQTIFIDFPARRAISVTSAQDFAPPIILQANLSG